MKKYILYLILKKMSWKEK